MDVTGQRRAKLIRCTALIHALVVCWTTPEENLQRARTSSHADLGIPRYVQVDPITCPCETGEQRLYYFCVML